MPRSWLALLSAGPLAALAVALAPTPATAADEKEDVRFTTYDNVEIVGTWYKGNKGKNSPVAILLHAAGGDNSRNKGDWDKLAKALQALDMAVLTFDFRGHGDSTTVTPSFWNDPTNKKYVIKDKPNKLAINVKDFKSGYFPMLVNDITAARHFIDQKNDAMECNSSNILVVGAEDGAALGLLWVSTEWFRDTAPKNPFNPSPFKPAGLDVTAGIWLSFDAPNKASFFDAKLPFTKWAAAVQPAIRADYPMPLRNNFDQLFLYGGKDDKTKVQADYVYNEVLLAKKNDKKYPELKDTFLMDVGDSTGGIALFGKPGLKTDNLINKYITEKTIGKKSAVWKKKEPSDQIPPVPLSIFGFTGVP